MQGNPINTGVGNKVQIEVDYAGVGSFPLDFKRVYNSLYSPYFSSFGGRWSGNYDKAVMASLRSGQVVVTRAGGKAFFFTMNGDVGVSDPDVTDRLSRTIDGSGNFTGWEYLTSDRKIELYDVGGKLLSVTDRNGYSHFMEYSDGSTHHSIAPYPGLLVAVRDSWGRRIEFTYDGRSRLAGFIDPAGGKVEYDYDVSGNLITRKAQDGLVRTYLYNELEHRGSQSQPYALTGIVAEDGLRYATFKYDNQGRAVSTEHADGVEKVSVAYGAGSSATVTDASGATRTFTFTSKYNVVKLTSVQEPCPSCAGGTATRSLTLDANGFTDLVTDRAGTTVDFDSDARGLEVRRTESANKQATKRIVETAWHATFRVPVERSIRDAAGNLARKTQWTYNARGQALTSTRIDPATPTLTRTTTYSYCEASDIAVGTCPLLGLLTSEDGPRTDVADIIRYTYYPSDDSGCATSPAACLHRKGDLWKVENALGQSSLEVLRYDGAGRVLSTRDINGVTTDYDYHARGWPLAVKVRGTDPASDADDRITQLDYWPTGLVKKVTLPDGAYASYTYDAAHRLTDITDEVGNTIHYTLDNGGKRTREDTKTASGTLKRTLSRVYNLLDEVQSVKDASQNATTFSYDSHGNPDTTTDALGRVTDQDHDPLNRLIRSLQDVGGLAVETKLAYNALDQVTQVTDPKGLNTTYGYNGFGDQIQLSSPDTGVTSYTYDSAGNRGSQTDARGVTSSYSYDALNRLIGVSYPTAGLNTTYTYDSVQSACSTSETFAKGRLTAMTDASGSTQYCYDRFGQLMRKVQSSNGKVFTLRYAYTPSGRISSLTYPDGAVANYVRDVQGKISQIEVTPAGATPQVLLNQASHHPFGPVAGWTYGNGRSLSRPLNLNYQPTAVQDSASGGLSVGFGFDVAGNLNQLTPAGSSTSLLKYDYDGLDRLTHLRDGPSNTPIETYSYDATGNRLSLTQAGGTQTYVYPATSHRLAQVGNSGLRGYDASGNTTEIDANSFVYNDAGRMSQFKQGGVLKMTYLYNGLGEQVRKYTDTYNRYMVYDESGHWLGEYDSNGATIQQAIWMDDLPVGVLAGGGAQQKLHYVEPDHLGTPRVVIDPVRNVAVWNWDLKGEAFGNSAPNQDPDLDGTAFVFDMRFPGQRFDSLSGLSYNYYRDYEADTGRYAQSDPIGLEGGVSIYSYVGGDPLTFADPYGLDKEYINLGKGYAGRIDNFIVRGGQASFEIHVFEPSSNGKLDEIGVYGPKGWFNKHGLKGRPEGIPDFVDNACQRHAIGMGRRLGLIPAKGTANLKKGAWKRFLAHLPAIGVLIEASTPSPQRACGIYGEGSEECQQL